MANWHERDPAEWSNPEVRLFMDAVLPGHPCTGSFNHTSGRVLCTLSKEDLRRQTRDDEASNVIWAELLRLRAARAHQDEVASHGAESYTIFVRTPAGVSVELEVLPMQTVAGVKAQLAKVEGTPVEMQRLTRNGGPMLDARTLASYNVSHGAVLLMVPRLSLSGGQRSAAPPAGRGPQGPAAATSGILRPRVPLVCTDIARPFPMSLEFEGILEYQTFMLALQRQAGRGDPRDMATAVADENAPFLEVLSADSARQSVQTRVTFDAETEVLRIDTLGDILMECTRYRVLLHLREDQKSATLVTGVRSADR